MFCWKGRDIIHFKLFMMMTVLDNWEWSKKSEKLVSFIYNFVDSFCFRGLLRDFTNFIASMGDLNSTTLKSKSEFLRTKKNFKRYYYSPELGTSITNFFD